MLASCLLLPVGQAAAAPTTTCWTNSGTGDYVDPANWSDGVPVSGGSPTDMVHIGNGGTAVINPGDAAFAEKLYLGDDAYPDTLGGHLIMNGGTFTTGNNSFSRRSAAPDGNVTFTLNDGTYHAWSLSAWTDGYDSVFTQNGGDARIVAYNGYVNPSHLWFTGLAGENRVQYRLNGGSMTAANGWVLGGAEIEQHGGTADYGRLAVGVEYEMLFQGVVIPHGRFTMTDGDFTAHRGFVAGYGGTIDFGDDSDVDQAVHMNLSGLVDLREGTFVNNSLATAAVGEHSIVVLPDGVAGTDLFGGGFDVAPNAIVTTPGQPLNVGANHDIRAWGELDTFVTVDGGSLVSDELTVGNFEHDTCALNLHGGVMVTNNGHVDTSASDPVAVQSQVQGNVFINDTNSRIESGSLITHDLLMGGTAPGAFTQTGGTVTITYFEISPGLGVGGELSIGTVKDIDAPASPAGFASTYNMEDGELIGTNSGGELIVGDTGTGVFNQSGGTVDFTWLKMGNRYWSDGLEPDGTYVMTGGEAHFDYSWIGVGEGSKAALLVSGGEFVSNGLNLGYNEGSEVGFELTGGTVRSVGNLGMGREGSVQATQTDGTLTGTTWLIIGGEVETSTQHYDMQGGTIDVGAHLTVTGVGDSSFTQSGGDLTAAEFRIAGAWTGGDYGSSEWVDSAGTYDLQDGNLTTDTAKIGRFGTGTLNQSGGSFVVNELLLVGSGRYDGTPGRGTVNLNGGSITADDADIGDDGAGTVVQSAGTATITGTLALGAQADGDGEYRIGGGSLEAGTLEVGMVGAGSFAITNAAANVTVTEALTLGPNASLDVAPDAVVHMTGSAFDNRSTDPGALGDLAYLTLVFEGGAGVEDAFEVAGTDKGAVADGFGENFVLGCLQIGSAAAEGHVRLVDLFDNASGGGPEALYVERLVLADGSSLDLNGLSLYTHDMAGVHPGAVVTGGETILVPEPATLALLGLGGLALLRRRR